MDILESTLKAGVRVQTYVPTYGSPSNELEHVIKCTPMPCVRCVCSSRPVVDFRDKFRAYHVCFHAMPLVPVLIAYRQRRLSPKQRTFFCHETSAIVGAPRERLAPCLTTSVSGLEDHAGSPVRRARGHSPEPPRTPPGHLTIYTPCLVYHVSHTLFASQCGCVDIGSVFFLICREPCRRCITCLARHDRVGTGWVCAPPRTGSAPRCALGQAQG